MVVVVSLDQCIVRMYREMNNRHVLREKGEPCTVLNNSTEITIPKINLYNVMFHCHAEPIKNKWAILRFRAKLTVV